MKTRCPWRLDPDRGPASPAGFTLLELLVAAAITLVLAVLVLNVAQGALDLAQRTQGRGAAATTATLVLDRLEADLQSVWRAEPAGPALAVDLAADPAQLAVHGWFEQGVRQKPAGAVSLRPLPETEGANLPRIADARFGVGGAWLRLVTVTAESDAEPARPRVVAWQVLRRPVSGRLEAGNPAPVHYAVFRSAIGSATAFAHGPDVQAAAYASTSRTPGGTRSPATVMNPAGADALAAPVIDLGIWLYRREADGTLRRLFPSGPADTAHVADPARPETQPDVADVMVRVLSDEGARRLAAIEAGQVTRPEQFADDGNWWWAVAEAHSWVHVRRVLLRGGQR